MTILLRRWRATMIDKQTLLDRLDYRSFYQSYIPSLKVNTNGQAIGLCPFHDDNNPSLSVDLNEGLWNCHAGCGGGNGIDFYMQVNNVDFPTALREIPESQNITFPPSQHIERREGGKVSQKVVATFEYRDAIGNILYAKERLEPGRNGRSKQFSFYHFKENKRVSGRGFDPVLYNLSHISKSRYVIFVEGEAKADLLAEWGLPATCLDSGANSGWKDEYTAVLESKEKVVILPDNDSPGKEYSLKIANALYGKVGKIKIIDLPELPEKGDIIDWAEVERNNKDRLVELIKTAPEWKKISPLISSLDLVSDPNQKGLEWIHEGIIPKGSVVLLAGEPGAYKTWLALSLAEKLSKGEPFLERHTKRTKVYYIDRENPRELIIDRLNKVGRSKDFIYWGLWAEPEPPLLGDPIYLELAKEKPLIIFDTLLKFHGGDENSSRDMGKISKHLTKIRNAGATVVVLHHKGKGTGSAYRGSSEIVGGVDVAYSLSKDKEDGKILSLKGIKNRFVSEPSLTLEVISTEESFKIEDISREKERVKEFEKKENMIAVQAAMKDLLIEHDRPPTQGEIVEAVKDTMGRNEAVRLLNRGEGVYWLLKNGKHGSKIYSPLKASHLPTSYIEREGGKVEDTEEREIAEWSL